MCRAVTCQKCGKTTWAGCGKHVDTVRATVPDSQWCLGHPNIEIRKIQGSQIKQVADLAHDVVTDTYSKVYPPDYFADYLEYHNLAAIQTRAKQNLVLVAQIEEKLVGTGTLAEDEIQAVFVRPEYQNQGVGRLLVNKLESAAKQNGIVNVHLDATIVSVDYYRKLGYKEFTKWSLDEWPGVYFWRGNKNLD